MKLGTLPLAGGVLEGLPSSVLAALEAAANQLPAGAREQLRLDAEQAKQRPMLHLAAGGREPAAWCRIATDPRLAYGWFQLPQETQETQLALGTRVEGAAQVMDRAAAYCLRDFALVLKARGVLAPERFDVLAQVAQLHAPAEIVALVFELSVETQPTADAWTQLALWRARRLDEKGARSALETARREAEKVSQPLPSWTTIAIDESVAAAADLNRESAPSLSRARALLRLGRASEARSEVASAGTAPARHLASAGILARAALAESPCSRFDGGAWSSPFCRAFWRADPELRAALETLDQAWAEGDGRDADAVETYLAVAHVLREAVTVSGAESPAVGAAGARSVAVATAARAAAGLSPRLAGIAFYSAVREAIAQSLPLAKVEAIGASFGAVGDGALDSAEPFVQAGWLNIAVAYGAREDVSEVLARIPREPRPEFVALAAALGLRNAALHRREDYSDAAARVVESIASADAPGLVLMLAETEAVESPDALGRLLLLTQRLAAPGNGPALRTRAALDAAAALTAARRWAEVEATLAPFRDADPKARFFWVLARFALGRETRASLNAVLVPLESAANLRSADWRRWIAAATQTRAGRKDADSSARSPASQTHLADMSRWASGYRVTSETRLEPEIVFMSHLWPVP